MYPKEIPCDVAVSVYRGRIDSSPLLHKHTTNAMLMHYGGTNAYYDLGYFEAGMHGELLMVVSNAPSRHDDSVCHARVEVVEMLPK